MKKRRLFICLFILVSALGLKAQVPYEWPIIKAELGNRLDSINQKIETLWSARGHQSYCSSFAGSLYLANSNRGYTLFTPTPPGGLDVPYQNKLLGQVDTMLMMMDSLGYKSVDIICSYPVLVNTFPNHQLYLDFFKKVYAMARSKGFKIIENCQVSLANDPGFGQANLVSDIKNFYFNFNGVKNDTINTRGYETTMTQMMQTVIDSLAPDYLTLEMEPQTQAQNLFNLLSFSPDSTLAYTNYFLGHLIRKGNILFGAGAGTWNQLVYWKNYAKTSVDYLDYHVYTINSTCFNNTVFQVDSIARANSKKLVIGECGLHKNSDSEYVATNALTIQQLVGERNVFNYFEGLDTLFTQAMINLSQQANIELVDFFGTPDAFGYINYVPAYDTMSLSRISTIGTQDQYSNMFKMKLGPLGSFTKKAIAGINCASAGITESGELIPELKLFPNPVPEKFAVVFSFPLRLFEIENMLGQQIAVVKPEAAIVGTQEIDVHQLSPGIYFLKANGFAGNAVVKFIKE